MPIIMNLRTKLRVLFNDLIGTATATRNVAGVGYTNGDYMMDVDPYGSSLDSYSDTSGKSGIINSLDLPMREAEGLMSDSLLMSRRQRYTSYDSLEELVPEVDATLNVYADEASSCDAEYHTIKIKCSNQGVKDELEFLFYKILKIDDRAYRIARNLSKYGDWFGELVVDPEQPHLGVMNINELDPYTIWRIQSRRGKLLEFQQTRMAPDYDIVYQDLMSEWQHKNNPGKTDDMLVTWKRRTTESTRPGLIRFAPAQVVHMVLGGEKRGFAPYGNSILVSARKPAYNLRLLEDSMLLYRLIRSPERRVYYVDMANVPPHKTESFLNDFKSKVKRRKIYNDKTGQIDERYNPWSIDDDLFIPVRKDTNTRVETLPGAANLGEIDDAIYFRRKFYLAVGIPPGYLEQTIEAQTNRLTLSSQAMIFAKKVFRVQRVMRQGLLDIATRHLILQGVPETLYEDLDITITQPSEWRELAQSEVLNNRATLAQSVSALNVVSKDYVRMNIMKMSEEENETEKRRIAQETIEAAELEGQKSLIAARFQAEVDRGNKINEARTAAELAASAGSLNPPPDQGSQGPATPAPPEETPTVDQLVAAAPEPEDMAGVGVGSSPEKPKRSRLDPADAEVEREGY